MSRSCNHPGLYPYPSKTPTPTKGKGFSWVMVGVDEHQELLDFVCKLKFLRQQCFHKLTIRKNTVIWWRWGYRVLSICGRSCPFVGPCVVFVSVRGPCVTFVSVRGPSCRICVHLWASVSVCGPLCRVCVAFVALVSHLCPFVGPRVAFMGVRVRWWPFVSVGGRSSWRHGWCYVGPVSHVKEEEGGRGVVGLTWMHDARRGTSSSPCTGLVTWHRGVVLVCCGVAVCRGLCEVDGGR